MERDITGTTGDDSFEGTSDDERYKGLAGDDVINGGGGDDTLVGNTGNDTIDGGAGSDRIFGCEDDDVLDGGAGQDFVNAGSGRDRLIFDASDARGPGFDYYDGHNGIDRLELILTAAQFAQAEDEIAAFLAFIAATTGENGESGGRSSDEFGDDNAGAFFFFETLNLAARRIEQLQVIVDGVVVLGADIEAEDDTDTVTAGEVLSGSVAENDDVPAGSTFVVVTPPSEGVLSLESDGTYSYTPDASVVELGAGEAREVSFTYRVITPGGESREAVAIIRIEGVNDAPVVAGALTGAFTEDEVFDGGTTEFVLNPLEGASDPDGDTLSVADISAMGEDGRAVEVELRDGQLIVDSAQAAFQNLAAGETLIVTINYNIVDGQDGVTPQAAVLTVTGVDDAFTLGTPSTGLFFEDEAFSGPTNLYGVDVLVGSNDPDGDALSVSNLSVTSDDGRTVVAALSGSTVLIDSTQAAFQSLAEGQEIELTFTFDVSDTAGNVVPGAGTVTVVGVNDAPTVSGPVTDAFAEDDLFGMEPFFTLDLLANAQDVDGDTLLVNNLNLTTSDGRAVLFTPSFGAVTIPTNQDAFQNLAAGDTLTLNFSYDVVDAQGASVEQTAVVVVTGTNDAPNFVPIMASRSEDAASFIVDLLAGVSDIDAGDVVTVSNVKINLPILPIAEGSTMPPRQAREEDGEVTVDLSQYQRLAEGEDVTIEVGYTLSDGESRENLVALLTIEGENDVPTIAGALTRGLSDQDNVVLNLLEGARDIDATDQLTISEYRVLSGDGSGLMQEGSSLLIDGTAYDRLNETQTEVIVVAYNVIDGNGGVVPQTATITISGTGANIVPSVNASVGSRGEDSTSITVDVLDRLPADPDGPGPVTVSNFRFVDANGDELPAGRSPCRARR